MHDDKARSTKPLPAKTPPARIDVFRTGAYAVILVIGLSWFAFLGWMAAKVVASLVR